MSANTDVEQGFLAAWKAANLNGPQVSAGAPGGGPGTGPILGGIGSDKRPRPRPPLPYAVLEVGNDPKQDEFNSGQAYIDYRRVKLTLYGIVKTDLGNLATTVLQGIYKTATAWIPLTIPNAIWMRTELVNDEIEVREPVGGEDVRAAPMEFRIWSQRNIP